MFQPGVNNNIYVSLSRRLHAIERVRAGVIRAAKVFRVATVKKSRKRGCLDHDNAHFGLKDLFLLVFYSFSTRLYSFLLVSTCFTGFYTFTTRICSFRTHIYSFSSCYCSFLLISTHFYSFSTRFYSLLLASTCLYSFLTHLYSLHYLPITVSMRLTAVHSPYPCYPGNYFLL